MHKVICETCNKEFETNHSTKKFCSKECIRIQRKTYPEKIKAWRKSHPEENRAIRKLEKLKHPEYRILSNIYQRCNNPKADAFSHYGARGIKCLLTSADVRFLMKEYGYFEMKEIGLKPQIHRLNPNGDYEISNCVFLPIKIHKSIEKLTKQVLSGRRGETKLFRKIINFYKQITSSLKNGDSQ